MREVISNIYLLEGLRVANVYLLVSGDDLTLVDSGLSSDADKIITQLQGEGFAPSRLRYIVLTHAHGDHVGSAPALAQRTGAQILAHQDEIPYIEGTLSLPAASLFQRITNYFSTRFMSGKLPCKVDQPLEDGDMIATLGGLQVIHMPGHTPGSISLYQPEQRLLFCGDTLFHGSPATGRGDLQFPIPMATIDSAQARESVRKLTSLPLDILCPGHGEPIMQNAGERIQALF